MPVLPPKPKVKPSGKIGPGGISAKKRWKTFWSQDFPMVPKKSRTYMGTNVKGISGIKLSKVAPKTIGKRRPKRTYLPMVRNGR